MSIITDDEITPHIANGVLFAFCGGGYPFGDFGQDICRAAARADNEHLAALAKGFPGLIKAFRIAQTERGGLDQLREIAGS